ncbi:MAG TPA: AGE family epimerase/isomerase, partial [Opitutales bacterium]|nr:AGE family epimerase/isomerase [Opitutales bacterium]
MRNVLGPSLAAIVVACCFVACSRSGHDALSNASTIPPDAAEISALRISAEAEFTGNILPFWMKNAPDSANGGFHGFVGDDLKPDPAAERGALLDTRILWTFSGAYLTTGRRVYLDMAARAYSDLQSRFFDAKSGGYFWAARPDGTISDPRKMLYVQAFAIYALSQYHRATGDRDALKNAIDLYRLVEEKCRDRVNGGYFEEFDSQWNPIAARAPGDSPLGATDQKSQNVHLHMMEAYTGLYRIWPDRTLAADLAAL